MKRLLSDKKPKRLLQSKLRFNKSLYIFVIIFALVGIYVLYRAFALTQSSTKINFAIRSMASPSASNTSYWVVNSAGDIYSQGDKAKYFGSAGSKGINDVVGIVALPHGDGYYINTASGAVYNYGSAKNHGSMAGQPMNKPVVGMAIRNDNTGYWLVGADGGVFNFGSAGQYGSLPGIGIAVSNIVGIVARPQMDGYWLFGSDGGVFSFGKAPFAGSLPNKKIKPEGTIVGMAVTNDGKGYWLVSSTGRVYSFGKAKSYGSLFSLPPGAKVVGINRSAYSKGYWIFLDDGTIHAFGNAKLNNDLVPSYTKARSSKSNSTIVASGDMACNPASSGFNNSLGSEIGTAAGGICRMKATSELAMNLHPGLVLALGDNQYESGTLDAFQASYAKTWGRTAPYDLFNKTRPIAGNHEYRNSVHLSYEKANPDGCHGAQSGSLNSYACGYFDYFNGVGKANGRAGERGKGYYSFDYNGWHFIALNTNLCFMDNNGCSEASEQLRWLKNDLKATRAKCTLAFQHRPRFSSGYDGDNTRLTTIWNLLYEYNADIVLAGHSHNYERLAPLRDGTTEGIIDNKRGITQFIVGNGGKNFTGYYTDKDGIVNKNQNSQKWDNERYGVLKINMSKSSYSFEAIAIDGSVIDSGSGKCH